MKEHIMYAAVDMLDEEKPIIGIFHTKSEAKEVLLAEAQNCAYHIINTHLPPEGKDDWVWEEDYPRLIKEFLDTTTIQEVEVKCLCE